MRLFAARDDSEKMPMKRANWAALAFCLFGAVTLLAGGRMIRNTLHVSSGSSSGWLLLTLGILCVLAAIGLVTGAYEE